MFSTVAVCVIAAFITSECYGALTTVPVPQTAFVGQRVVFQCATTNASCTIQWYIVSPAGGQVMVYNGHDSKDGYSVDHSTPESYDLIINHTTTSDAGIFYCQEGGSCFGQSAHAPMIVFDVESATNTTSQLATGDVVLVSCRMLFYWPKFPTYSNVSVTIYDRAENAVANQSYQFIAENRVSDNTTLTLSTNVAVTEPTFGPFQCEARCLDVTPVISKRITVLQLHQVFYAIGAAIVRPPSGILSPGDVVNCSASGYPEPSYFWERNLNTTWDIIHNGSVLQLVTPGTYILRCTAYNTVRNIPHTNTSRDVEFHISETTGTDGYRPTYSNQNGSHETGSHTTISSSRKPNNNSSANVGVGSNDSSTSKVAVGVGVGVGVGGGLLLLVLIVVLVIFCIRHKKEKAKPTEKTLYEAPGFVNSTMPEAAYTSLDHIQPDGQSDVLRTDKDEVPRDSDYLESHIHYQPLTVGHRQTNEEYSTLNVKN